MQEAEEKIKSLIRTSEKHEAENIANQASSRQIEEELRNMKENQNGLLREKELVAQELQRKTTELEEIHSWCSPLWKPNRADRQEMSVPDSWSAAELTVVAYSAAKIGGFFPEAYKLVLLYFGDDLPDRICHEANAWDALRKHEAVSGSRIPLPSSNSPPAKQMRIAAVLAVLGHHLAEQIFQPLYVLDDGDELGDVLSELASDEPRRETFLRSVLLAVRTDREQQECRNKRIAEVFKATISTVQPLIADGKQENFRRALRDLCSRFCDVWLDV